MNNKELIVLVDGCDMTIDHLEKIAPHTTLERRLRILPSHSYDSVKGSEFKVGFAFLRAHERGSGPTFHRCPPQNITWSEIIPVP